MDAFEWIQENWNRREDIRQAMREVKAEIQASKSEGERFFLMEEMADLYKAETEFTRRIEAAIKLL
jgi:hypothetical protein